MNRLASLVGPAVVASLVCGAWGAAAQSADSRAHGDQWGSRVARALEGSIEGSVLDETGRPLAGATVSAVGTTSALSVTDGFGRYRLRALPPGVYLVRAHLAGYLASRREAVEVRSAGPVARYQASLRKVGLTELKRAPDPPKIFAASLGLVSSGTGDAADGRPADAATSTADHGEVAWRLRHLTRSVLKDTTEQVVAVAGGASPPPAQPGVPFPAVSGFPSFGSIHNSAAARAASFIASLPLSGEVKLLTTSALEGLDSLFAPEASSRSVAAVSLSGPAWRDGDWFARALLSEGDTTTWYVATAVKRRGPAEHRYDVGFSYATKSFGLGPGGPLGLNRVGTRTAMNVYGLDQWTLTPRIQVDAGANFARYGYMPGFGLLSPRVGVALVPTRRLRIESLVAQRMLSPGAEEFMQPMAVGLWTPPGRTFLNADTGARVDAEQSRHYEVSVQQDLFGQAALRVRTFVQQVRSQQTALFGTESGTLPAPSFGHYLVSNAGDLNARGWSVGLTNAVVPWVRGAVSYEVTVYDWVRMPDADGLGSAVAFGLGRGPKRLHDLSGSVETDIPYTATRVVLLCKMNTGFARTEGSTVRPGFDGRFDLQVTQRLPFLDFTSADWQLLVAVRNFFRDAAVDASVFDELLVVRPPKRVVGGVLVRF